MVAYLRVRSRAECAAGAGDSASYAVVSARLPRWEAGISVNAAPAVEATQWRSRVAPHLEPSLP